MAVKGLSLLRISRKYGNLFMIWELNTDYLFPTHHQCVRGVGSVRETKEGLLVCGIKGFGVIGVADGRVWEMQKIQKLGVKDFCGFMAAL